MKPLKVNETLTVESYAGEYAGGHRQGLRIVRAGGGLVAIDLDEVRHLIAALNEGAARLAAELAGEPYENNLF